VANPLSGADRRLWEECLNKRSDLLQSYQRLLEKAKDKVAVVRNGLGTTGGRDCALSIMAILESSEQQSLFDAVLRVACDHHRFVGQARAVILTMPRQWVLENITRYGDALLLQADHDMWRRFLELCEVLDTSVLKRFAERASKSADPDAARAGRGFLARAAPGGV
jgi:hypothetical protein